MSGALARNLAAPSRLRRPDQCGIHSQRATLHLFVHAQPTSTPALEDISKQQILPPPIPPFSSHIPLRNLARDSSKKSIVSPNAPSANLCLLAGAVADAPIQPSGALHEEYLVHSLFFLYPVWKSPSLSLGAHHRPLFVPAQWLMRTRNATSRFCVDSGH